jgi:DNA sulfur modification protein DndE
MIESIRLTESEKEMLSRIKRKTGVASWNVLCRWAFMLGLTQDSFSRITSEEKRDAIEIKWDTFAGKSSSIYTGIIQLQYAKELKSEKTISLFDFVHGVLSTGIRVLSKSAAQDDLKCFNRSLNLGK